jgi:MarR family transcriptional regulator, transcriptional regulator for hemolysin
MITHNVIRNAWRKLNMDRLRTFGFLLKGATRLYVQRFEQRARRFGVTLPQWKALGYLSKNEGISQARLAELAETDPMTLVRILDRMEADGLVERRPDPSDRRARRLYLTRKATPFLETMWHLSDLTRAEAFEGISRKEREVFIDILTRIHANLSGLADAPIEDEADPSRATRAQPVEQHEGTRLKSL